MSKLFVSIFFCVFATGLGYDISKYQSQNYACNEEAVDQLDEVVLKAAVLGDADLKYPTNEEEARAQCQSDRTRVTWGKNYTKKCMGGRQKEISHHVSRLLMFSFEKVLKKRCRTETTRKLYVEAGKCGNMNSVKSQTVKCWQQYIIDYQQINKAKFSKIKNEKHRVPLICCKYHKFHECANDAYTDPDHSRLCTKKAADELDGYIVESMYDILQYICADYQEYSDKCDNLVKKYSDVWTTTKLGSRPKSPLSEANDIFDSVPGV